MCYVYKHLQLYLIKVFYSKFINFETIFWKHQFLGVTTSHNGNVVISEPYIVQISEQNTKQICICLPLVYILKETNLSAETNELDAPITTRRGKTSVHLLTSLTRPLAYELPTRKESDIVQLSLKTAQILLRSVYKKS